jgi:hypothetical protein
VRFAKLLLFSSVLFCVSGFAVESKIQVMGWVPAYGLNESMAALESQALIGEGLTRLGLQLWNPSPDGRGLVLAPVNKQGQPVRPEDVVRFRDWAKKRGIKVFLTVYNNSQVMGEWDWALARRAFAQHRAEFSHALLAEMNKYELDGIDLDLEGEGELDSDRPAYAQLIRDLSAKLKGQGKLLTVDSFHSPCMNAPNMSWWGDWLGYVDAIHSMGYEDLYEGSEQAFTPEGKSVCEDGAHIFKYSWQLRYAMRAGYKPGQILMGMPTWLDSWGKGGLGKDIISHVHEAQALGVGVALWDLQLAAAPWRSAAIWQAIRVLRDIPVVEGKLPRQP